MGMIDVRDLTKIYDSKIVAVDHISFSVKEGEVVAMLGPNGTGKTTTVKMLTTLTRPTSGEAELDGHSVVRNADEVRRIVGIVPQDLSVDDDLTGMENLILQSKLYHIPSDVAKKRAIELLRLVDLEKAAFRDVEIYSGGMRKRLEIICGLISHPRVLFLDEPTLGLDLQSRIAVRNYLKKLKHEQNLTLFLTTHYMEEADYIADRVIIMDKGRIVSSGTPVELKISLGPRIFELTLEGDPDSNNVVQRIQGVLTVDRVDASSYRVKIKCTEEELTQITRQLEATNVRIISSGFKVPTMDDVFLYFTGSSLTNKQPLDEQEGKLTKYLNKKRNTME
ncbi:MAG: ATP-binding cassette domain-containing protein [Nitrososphaerales archaeon]